MTNFEYLKSLSDIELSKELANISGDKIGGMSKFWLEWLRLPYKGDESRDEKANQREI